MGKRILVLTAKAGQLVAKWGRPSSGEAPDLVYAWGGAGANASDMFVLQDAFEKLDLHEGNNLRQELEARGYDISTFRFSINLKETPCA
jgi:hypothetical protein